MEQYATDYIYPPFTLSSYVGINQDGMCVSCTFHKIFTRDSYSHYLIISGKHDVCTDGQGNEHCCGFTPLLCEQISHFIQKNEDKMSRNMKATAQNLMCKNDVVTPSLKI